MEDQELIKRIAMKDHAAFGSLVEQYQAAVLRICYRILGNQQDAEDVVQEVFIKVYKKAKRFRGKSKISTWLFRIAVNLAIDFRRRQKWNHYLDVLTLSENKSDDIPNIFMTAEKVNQKRKLSL